MQDRDDSERLLAAVRQAVATDQPLAIQGAGSKGFLGTPLQGRLLSTLDHCGVIDYRPEELVVQVRSGTLLTDLNALLDRYAQMLPFEPPMFGGRGTIGGAVAAGLAGPGRPWRGSVRDSVLGIEMVNGRGERLNFGGQVIKNVAGYDLSRLMAGACGTLGLLLSISLRLIPKPETEQTRVLELSPEQATDWHWHLGRQAEPVTATCFDGERLHLRLSGSLAGVAAAARRMGGQEDPEQGHIWQRLRDHEHDMLVQTPLWRCVLPVDAPDPWPARYLVEWGGRQRWLQSEFPGAALVSRAQALGGHAGLFNSGSHQLPLDHLNHPRPDAASLQYQKRLKTAFDPSGIFNPGRLFTEF